jgi:putative addiction module component (TIGR02574 family)
MSNRLPPELERLSPAERIHLAQDLWDSIPAETAALPLSDGQVPQYERRLAAHRADPSSSIPWSVARAALRERFGA